MGDTIVLRMHYIHSEYVEIEVGDPDKSNLLDLYVDLLEGAAKIGMVLPEQPTLWYTHNSWNFQLKSDVDLMEMFNKLHEKKVISLIIGSAESPCKNLELARGLIESKRHVDNSTTPRSSHGTTGGERNASMTMQSHHSLTRVPATSARRKGLYVPKVVNTSRSSGSEPTSGNLSRTSEVSLVSSVPVDNVQDDEGVGVAVQDDEGVGVAVQDDIAVNVQRDEPAGIDAQDDELFGLAAEADVDMDKGDYVDRVYDNGEFYEDHDGDIILKEWMIFMDKDKLLDVVTEYCVQEGINLVVKKNEHNRYTALCADSDCEWRIHASELPDGKTWAIKSLKNDHTCMRLNVHNPMATPEWASRKILDDVSANENITGKPLISYCFI